MEKKITMELFQLLNSNRYNMKRKDILKPIDSQMDMSEQQVLIRSRGTLFKSWHVQQVC